MTNLSRLLLGLAVCSTAFVVGCGGGTESPEVEEPETSLGEEGELGGEGGIPAEFLEGIDDGTDTEPDDAAPKLAVVKSEFGKLSEEAGGATIDLYTLTNTKGLEVGVITYGALLTGVHAPDKDGNVANLVLQHEDMAGWQKNPSYFSCTVGRYANRIEAGKFTIDGTEYQVTVNEEARGNMLHGGAKGFDKQVWSAQPIEQEEAVGVELKYTSADGEEGFPGELTTTVRYLLDESNQLTMEYEAETTKPTPVNLTNHCYWNLAGADSGNVLDQVLQLSCDAYLEVNENLIPTGDVQDVEDRPPFDFREAKPIGAGIENLGDGFDHCFVVNGEAGTLRHVATVTDPESGRTMTIESTEPGVQFYTANHLSGKPENNGYGQHQGFCLECNHYPNSPNVPEFPSTILKPGETYSQKTVHTFGLVEVVEE